MREQQRIFWSYLVYILNSNCYLKNFGIFLMENLQMLITIWRQIRKKNSKTSCRINMNELWNWIIQVTVQTFLLISSQKICFGLLARKLLGSSSTSECQKMSQKNKIYGVRSSLQSFYHTYFFSTANHDTLFWLTIFSTWKVVVTKILNCHQKWTLIK